MHNLNKKDKVNDIIIISKNKMLEEIIWYIDFNLIFCQLFDKIIFYH